MRVERKGYDSRVRISLIAASIFLKRHLAGSRSKLRKEAETIDSNEFGEAGE